MRTVSRNGLSGALAMILVVLVGSVSVGQAQQRQVVIASWGDPYESMWRKNIFPAFERKHNARVVYVPGISSETIARIEAQRSRPQMDVGMMDSDVAIRGRSRGVFSRIDPNQVPNLSRLYSSALDPNGLGVNFGYGAIGLYYNTRVFQERGWAPPTSWYDLWDPKYKGHVTFHSIVNGFGLRFFIMMALLEGKSIKNYEVAIAKIKALVPNAITIDRAAETARLIQLGEAWIGTWGIDRAGQLIAQGIPIAFVIPKEGTIELGVSINLVRGAPNPELAHAFINYMLSDEVQALNAREASFGPANRFVKLPPDVVRRVIYGEEQFSKLIQPDWHYVTSMRSLWTDIWNREVER